MAPTFADHPWTELAIPVPRRSSVWSMVVGRRVRTAPPDTSSRTRMGAAPLHEGSGPAPARRLLEKNRPGRLGRTSGDVVISARVVAPRSYPTSPSSWSPTRENDSTMVVFVVQSVGRTSRASIDRGMRIRDGSAWTAPCHHVEVAGTSFSARCVWRGGVMMRMLSSTRSVSGAGGAEQPSSTAIGVTRSAGFCAGTARTHIV